MHESLGDRIVAAATASTGTVMLVAPFIKEATLRRLVERMPTTGVICVTRWVPEEIVAGVSDLEIWELFRAVGHRSLYLRPDLHAKYYRFGDVVFAGSANLTARALGWCAAPNLEFLYKLDAADAEAESFERSLLSGAVHVDQRIFDDMAQAVSVLARDESAGPLITLARNDARLESWCPALSHPEYLYDCYRGREGRVLSSLYADGQEDLKVLDVPSGLALAEFRAFIASRLRTLPVVGHVDSSAVLGIDSGVGQAVARSFGLGNGERRSCTGMEWAALKAWLLHFMADRYREKVTYNGPVFERATVLRRP